VQIILPPHPQITGALGAALMARRHFLHHQNIE
jgi:activator of 2-hydroxyglutaryl-CoA dehydratase